MIMLCCHAHDYEADIGERIYSVARSIIGTQFESIRGLFLYRLEQ